VTTPLTLFLYIVAIIVVWWDMENVPPLPYDFLECSHALSEHFGFPPQREFGLVQCASAYASAYIWV